MATSNHRRRGRLALGSSLLLTLCACGDDSCDIETYTRDRAGIGAMDCNASPDVELIRDCILQQSSAQHPFRAIFPRGEDSYQGIVGTGHTFYTQRPAGGGIEEAECAQLEDVSIEGHQQMQCADPGDYSMVCE